MARRTARPQPTRDLELPDLDPHAAPAAAGRSGPPTRPAAPSPPSTASSGSASRSAAAATPTARGSACPLRPEQEGRLALPQHEFGLDVIALVGRLRHAEHRSVPEIHAELVRRGVPICAAQRRQPPGPLRRAAGPVAARTPSGCGGSPPRPGG